MHFQSRGFAWSSLQNFLKIIARFSYVNCHSLVSDVTHIQLHIKFITRDQDTAGGLAIQPSFSTRAGQPCWNIMHLCRQKFVYLEEIHEHAAHLQHS